MGTIQHRNYGFGKRKRFDFVRKTKDIRFETQEFLTSLQYADSRTNYHRKPHRN